MRTSWRQERWIIAIIGLYLFLGFAYAVLLPPWEAPDEQAHYRYALHITRHDSLPTAGDTYEATQPPLYYWLASWPLKVLDAFEPELIDIYSPAESPENITRPLPVYAWSQDNYRFERVAGLLSLRWLGVLSGGLALFFIYKGALRFVAPSTQIPLATAAVAGLTPQFLHISASANNDVLAILLGASLFWLLAIMIQEDLSWRKVLLSVLLAMMASFFVKLTILPLTLTIILAAAWQVYRRVGNLRLRVFALGTLILVGLLITVPLLTTEIGENILGQVRWRLSYIRPNALEPYEIINRYAQTYWGLVGWVAVGFTDQLVGILTTIGAFGWLASLRLLFPGNLVEGSWRRPVIIDRRSFIIATALVLSLVVLVGFIVNNLWITRQLRVIWLLMVVGWLVWWFSARPPRPGSLTGWLFLWLAVAMNVLVVGRNALATDKFQGRFLFPSISILMLLTTTGLYIMLPRQFRRFFVPVAVLFMIAINLVLWFTGILPVYFQPWLD